MMSTPRLHGLTRSALNALGLRVAAEKQAGKFPDLLIAAEKAAAAIKMGDHAQRRAGSGEKFWQFREYATGDRPQDIDWKQSGRGDKIHVRQKEWQTTQTALLWCQRDQNMAYASRTILPTKHEAAATLLLSLGILMQQAGELVGMLDGSVVAGRGEHVLQHLAEKMAEDGSAPLPHHLIREPAHHATLILAGDFLCPLSDIEHSVHALASRTVNILLLQVLDPAEINLPFRGRVIFESPQNGEKHHIINVETIRDDYARKMTEHNENLKSLCKHQGWHLAQHITDQDMSTTLMPLWQLLGDARTRKGP